MKMEILGVMDTFNLKQKRAPKNVYNNNQLNIIIKKLKFIHFVKKNKDLYKMKIIYILKIYHNCLKKNQNQNFKV